MQATETQIVKQRAPTGSPEKRKPTSEAAPRARTQVLALSKRETTTWIRVGGAEEDRTPDLLLAKQALSQLSYGPQVGKVRRAANRAGFWWVWEELNFRPRPYQGRALTN